MVKANQSKMWIEIHKFCLMRKTMLLIFDMLRLNFTGVLRMSVFMLHDDSLDVLKGN